ncbi:unnamed protein product [Effrenium voratum]|nr:unnamed protein product [Effrenium voratum]
MVLDAVRLLKANQLPVVVFKLQAACNVLSIAYGLQISNAAVLMTNMFGLACQVLFLAGDHYASVDSQWLFFALKISVLIDVGILCASSYVPMNILGQCITVCNVGLYSCPLMNMGNLLRTRNSSALPAFMVGINVLNNALWSLYALLIEDMVVLVPSLLGYCCSFFQIMLILWCRHLLPFDLSFLLTFFAQGKKPDASPELDHEDAGSPRATFQIANCLMIIEEHCVYSISPLISLRPRNGSNALRRACCDVLADAQRILARHE